MKKKALSIGLSSALIAGSLFAAVPAQVTVQAADRESTPADLNVVNTDRYIDSLVERGIISGKLNQEDKEAAMRAYLKRTGKGAVNTAAKNTFQSRSAKVKGAAQNTAVSSKQASGTTVAPAAGEAWNGGVRKDKLLVLLVEFDDYKHNNITPDETDMFYPDYTTEHYQQMMFSPTGYTGPNGEHFVSMAQYYLQQSGGSYTVEGDVIGWVKAPKSAAYYGGNVGGVDGDDNDPKQLIRDALAAAVAQGVDLSEYDQEDIYDLDGDGNYREPDGLIDHMAVIHAGVGEEAGGGNLGGDAIWSHRWDLSSPFAVPGSSTNIPYWGGQMAAFDYIIMPEDGATGVFAHEYGHDLGLPDEYDTIYSGNGEPIEYWSIMSAGSWAGKIGGTEPTGFSPYAKEYFQDTIGGNWQHGKTISLSDIPASGLTVTLDQATTKGANEDVVRIDLPDKVRTVNTPAAGSYEYWGGNGDEHDHSMVRTVDLTGATTAKLDFDTWYNIESTWDYAFAQVSTDNGATWTSLATNRTSTQIANGAYPTIAPNLPGYTGSSNGWVHETIDLSAYAGQTIKLQFRSITDWGTNLEGFYVDNVKVSKNGAEVFADGAEGTPSFTLNGFAKSEGKYTTKHHYLVEWRTHDGVDQGLAHIKRGQSLLSYDPGMVVWYVNEAYDNNWVGAHPGYGFLGVVDAHQNVHHWGGYASNGATAGTRYQVYDAAFSLKKGADLNVYYGPDQHLYNAAKNPVSTFDDKSSYWSPSSPHSGLKLNNYGLKIQVVGEAADRSAATIKITK
ncbi:antibacterial peptide protease [Tumebacillus sp. BK434]|uniref:immune inhibitor A domain-containing protein n=1 Tax=Tumebacillus sp. BK434 TaxID=2512169 RepID=UPI0010466D55|nr:immune inhibitor A domain-containing protein [Tumebacillus sp. BK434]TCP53355.1 antibacterial peptide protease [Tumebacillus sp. BK434]